MLSSPEHHKSLAEEFRQKIEKLKEHPFSLKTLESLARFLSGDETLRLTPIKGKVWKYCKSTNEILIPARHFQEDSPDRKDGLQILGILLHEIGHHRFTNFKLTEKIILKARELGLPEKVFAFLDNALEDPRVNQLMATEEQASLAINYVYEIDWAKRSIDMLPTLMDNVSLSDKEKLQHARYKQFGYNIIYFWRHKEFMPGTSDEVKAALVKCLPKINEAIYALGMEEYDPEKFETKDDYFRERAKLAHTLILSEPIWSTYVELVKKDIDELGNVEDEEKEDEMPPGMPPEDDVPPEDQDEYHPKDMESREAAGEKPHLFKMEPAPKESYFVSGIRSHFDKDTRRWKKVKNLRPYQTPSSLNALHKYSGKAHGLIALPLPKGWAIDLESLKHSGGPIAAMEDQHGIIYLKSDDLQEFSVDFGPNPDHADAPAASEDEQPLYNVSLSSKTEKMLKEASGLEPSAAAERVAKYIRENKKYNVKAQGRLYKSATHSDAYFRRIDQADELECYTANTFLVGLCRHLGIPARLVSGHHVTSSKDNCKKITRDTGHAWAEIWDGREWIRVDATPPGQGQGTDKSEEKSDAKDKLNKDADQANEELESKMEEASEKEKDELKDQDFQEGGEQANEPQEKKTEEGEKRETDFESHKDVPPELLRTLETAMEIAKPGADQIIEALAQIETEEDIEKIRQQLFQKKRKKRHGLPIGTSISTRQQAIMEIMTGGEKVMMANKKMKPREALKSEKLDCEFAVAVDLSGSMGNLAEDFSTSGALDKRSHAFLGVLTILQLSAYFHIPCHVVVFADKAATLKPETNWYFEDGSLNIPEIAKAIAAAFKYNRDNKGESIGGGNGSNGDGMRLALEALNVSKAKRLLAMVMSDGDGDSNQFLNNDSRRFFQEKDNLYALGLGIGEDASKESTKGKTVFGHKMSVIESQFHSEHGDTGYERTKGVNVGDFSKLVPILKSELFNFLAREAVNFKTGE